MPPLMSTAAIGGEAQETPSGFACCCFYCLFVFVFGFSFLFVPVVLFCLLFCLFVCLFVFVCFSFCFCFARLCPTYLALALFYVKLWLTHGRAKDSGTD